MSDEKLPLQERVNEAYRNGTDNENGLERMTALEVARDMIEFDADLEGEDEQEVAKAVIAHRGFDTPVLE